MHDPASDRLVLRDGSVATVRTSMPADRDALRRFFHQLSPESRHRRFFSTAEPPDRVIDRFADSSNPADAMTLIASRHSDDAVRPIAVASYTAGTDRSAEAAFAVADEFQGKGLGTALLERLAAIGAEQGFRWFDATPLTGDPRGTGGALPLRGSCSSPQHSHVHAQVLRAADALERLLFENAQELRGAS